MNVQSHLAYEFPSLHAAAFAWPTISSVIVTDRALGVLSDEKLEAICAHEVGRVTEPEHVKAMRSASVVWLLPLVATKPLIGSFGVGFYLALLVVTIWFRRYAQPHAAKRENTISRGVSEGRHSKIRDM